MTQSIDPSNVAQNYRTIVRNTIKELDYKVNVVGFLTTDFGPSKTYADYTKFGCEDVGINFELRKVERLNLENAILEANRDPEIHGVFVYYPIFENQQDNYIKDQLNFTKDIEGLSQYWVRKLYSNQRIVNHNNQTFKALLPCTPLAIVKLLSEAGIYRTDNQEQPLQGKAITIFNRSEVVGRPLAVMLANDGAKIYSFDEHGPQLFEKSKISEIAIDRASALEMSDVVITGVPNKSFPKIQLSEIKSGAICLNFSTIQNFEPDIIEKSSMFIPRVGPVTVAMCMRNALRLYENFHR
ncbi:MAG: methylenetetrahydrofolate dehydrogenase [Zetaproteobacteria bacterium]|nr:methylenetetrahydrofolate dehydrogenase [Pseudobdellovibrionaceae bacterium]